MSGFGNFGSSGRKNPSGYEPQNQDDENYSFSSGSPTQGSFGGGGNPAAASRNQGGYGGAGSGGDEGDYGYGGGFQEGGGYARSGDQGSYGSGNQPGVGFGGQQRSSDYGQESGTYGANQSQQGNWGTGRNPDYGRNEGGNAYNDESFQRGYGAGPGVPGQRASDYGTQGNQGQDPGQKQSQQKEKGGFMTTAKSLYKDLKKDDKNVGTNDQPAESGRSNFF